MQTGTCPESMVTLQKASGYQVATGPATLDRHYVRAGEIAERPACPAVLRGQLLEQLPVPCDIVINTTSYRCEDASAQLNFSHPGTYQVRVVAFPYLDANFAITV
jgi:hypothetical protein